MAALNLGIAHLFLDNIMTTLKQFLIEYIKYATKSRSKKIDLTAKQIINWIEKNSPQYIKRAKTTPIFRGKFSHEVVTMVSPQDFTRQSANTSNIYTELIDSFPSWSDYPKRSKSLVCSTANEGYVTQYGEIHLVIPVDNAKVGICPVSDFWGSFKTLQDVGIDDMDEFNNTVYDIVDTKSVVSSTKKFKIKNAKIYDTYNSFNERFVYNSFNERFVKHLMNSIVKNNSSLYDELEKYLNPKDNGFKNTTASQFNDKTGNKSTDGMEGKEVWVSGTCMLINLSTSLNNETIEEVMKHFDLKNILKFIRAQ